jgi:hypothetical protein
MNKEKMASRSLRNSFSYDSIPSTKLEGRYKKRGKFPPQVPFSYWKE